MKTNVELRMDEALRDIQNGVGWSTDKQLARYYGVTRKTIWDWTKDPDVGLPAPKKLGKRRTRWSNQEIQGFDRKIHFNSMSPEDKVMYQIADLNARRDQLNGA
jgi:predicted DNA-binding transcriptional regulator AlpA